MGIFTHGKVWIGGRDNYLEFDRGTSTLSLVVGGTTVWSATTTTFTSAMAQTFASIVGSATPFPITGLAAAQGGAVTITGGASSTTGNAGGAVNHVGGAGGLTGAGGAIVNTGAAGGATSGTGGAVVNTGGAGTAGASVGGAVSNTGGAGSAGATTVAGGAGGASSVAGGAGGAKTGTGAAAGGAGGAASVAGGVGGATASAGTDAGGAGGDIAVTAGAGGAASAGTGNGGAGGSIVITPGAGGTSAGGTAGKAGIIIERGVKLVKQGTQTAKTQGATLTAAEILVGIITTNAADDAADNYQLCEAADLDTALPDAAADDAFDFSVINIGTHADEDVTVVTHTGWTLVGNMVVASNAAAGDQSAGRFRARKTGAAAWTLYRIA